MLRKKLLSLGLAGVMVASTGVTAFAQNQTVGGNDTQIHDANVTVKGTVSKADGTAPEGKIQVELPTTLTFAVDKAGNFNAAPFTIKNQSSDSVTVMVGSFSETIKDGGITIKPEGESLADKDRSHIHLKLKGDAGEIDLGDTLNANEVLSVIAGGSTSQVQVLGDAGKDTTKNTDVDTKGATEDFNLVFKIKKS